MKFLHSAVKLALLLPLGCVNALPDNSVTSIASTDNFIIYEENTNKLWSPTSGPLKFQSDVPLTIQRYEKDYDYIGWRKPIYPGEGIILVTSNCDTGATTNVPVVEIEQGKATIVKIKLGITAEESSPMPFLKSSSYDATWYEYACRGFFDTPPPVGRPTSPPMKTADAIQLESTACLTEADCDGIRQKMGVSKFQVGSYPSKGCFSKNGIAYWGRDGSVDDMSRSDLPGIQTRIWCEKEIPKRGRACVTQSECDRKRLDMGIAKFSAGNWPSKGCFSKNGVAYWGSGGSAAENSSSDLPGIQERIWCGSDNPILTDVACLTKEDCDDKRQEMGIESFSSGNYPSKGCFVKNGKSYFSTGSVADMSEAILPGIQERLWCAEERASSINSVIQQTNDNIVPREQQEGATSSAFSLGPIMFSSFLHYALSAKPDQTPSSQSRALDSCSYNAEILLYGCNDDGYSVDIEVAAPKARVINSGTKNGKQEDIGNDEIKNTATLVFPDDQAVAINVSDDSYIEIPPADEWTCGDIVCGRPFVDSEGHSLIASPFLSDKCGRVSSWLGETAQSPVSKNSRSEKELAEEWTKSALGEHASVASFAAFSIALMSNQAPSHLVEDSLKAAQDEVRHAKASFDIASKLAGEEMGPGPLPPSSHEFHHDLTALAMSVAKEGCVDETLSALAAAAEVDLIDEVLKKGAGEATKYSGIDRGLLTWIRNELRTISMDESNHSALAWRTLNWVCAVDANACDEAKRSILDKNKLNMAFQLRFGHYLEGNPKLMDQMMAAWANIYTNQNVLRSDVGPDGIADCVDGVAMKGNGIDLPNTSLLSLLVENISMNLREECETSAVA